MVSVKFDIQPNEFSKKKLEPAKFWENLDLEVLGFFYSKYPTRVENDLEKKGYIHKDIPKEKVDKVHFAKKTYSQKVQLDDDADGSYTFTSFKELGLLEDFRKASSFFSPTIPLLSSISDILKHIKEDVSFQLGSPWRVLMTRFWETKAGTSNEYMYGWHTDGMPHQFFKIMLYFGEMSIKHGSLGIKLDGKNIVLESNAPGSWVLFKNSLLFHRGIPPSDKKYIRLACEVTICRSFEYQIMPIYSGNNAIYPIFPWNNSMTNIPVDKLEGEKVNINKDKSVEKINDFSDLLNLEEQANLDLISSIYYEIEKEKN